MKRCCECGRVEGHTLAELKDCQKRHRHWASTVFPFKDRDKLEQFVTDQCGELVEDK